MPKEREDDFQTDEFEDLNENNQTNDETIDENIVEENNVEEEVASEKETDKKPWHKRFGSDENLRNRQYSRTSRNQPKQEASTLSKVLLGAFVVLLIIPFVVLLIVESQRSNEEIPGRTKEQVMISRSSISSESESSSESAASSESSASSQSEGNINVASGDESIGSQEIETTTPVESETTPAPTPEPEPVVEPTPEPTPEPAPSTSTTHTVSAGETWYGIARIHGINVYDLLAANGASEGTPIHPGDVVVVP